MRKRHRNLDPEVNLAAPLHSWDLATWPRAVWPGDEHRARWIARAYRQELIEAGALSRAGKTLIFIGHGYARWLHRRAAHVTGFAPNNPAMIRPKEAVA